jgi:nucleoside-diphosphate-sugar epimerase
MRVAIIGGTGHVGTYLVPRLIEAGHEVINISRGQQKPYQPHAAWKWVKQVVADSEAEDEAGLFAQRVHDLEPEVVIDMVCFTVERARHLVEALKGDIQQFLHCGTIWVHGPTVQPPTTEEQPRRPFGDYGIQKAAIEAYLLNEARRYGFPATILHPGHIVGPGWMPLNPAGHFNPQVFLKIARGEELVLPNFGMETVHRVHADDVPASACPCQPKRIRRGSFHVVSPAALTLRGYAKRCTPLWPAG